MLLTSTPMELWVAPIQDKPGGLVAKLQPLAQAGANLEFILARRDHAHPGMGVVFIWPVRAAEESVAAQTGFTRSRSVFGLRVQGTDEPGAAFRITDVLARKGINVRGASVAVVTPTFVMHLAFDSEADRNAAAGALSKS